MTSETTRSGRTGLPDLYQVGTIALVKQMVKLPGGNIRVMVEGFEESRAFRFR